MADTKAQSRDRSPPSLPLAIHAEGTLCLRGCVALSVHLRGFVLRDFVLRDFVLRRFVLRGFVVRGFVMHLPLANRRRRPPQLATR